MAGFLDELQSIPGVFGACLYHAREGVLQTNLPAVYTNEKLGEIGRGLSRIHAAGLMNFSDLTDLSIRFDESTLSVRKLNEDVTLFIILDADCNHNLVTMSLNIIQQEIDGNNLVPEPSQISPVKAEKPLPTKPAGEITADVEPILSKMKDLLAEVLGPMATLIFDEAVESWVEQGYGSKKTITTLIEMLEQEIGDEDKAQVYRGLIDPIL